ncbi:MULTISPECIES: methyl-accepting chemotaxis protein [unclassified Agarivorans]|uniref:methyl-accepting chemotaxis protein n=1 Tax=unclassified Agarivorans TaxID=2636026 RepID=UPI003D7DD5E0
MSFFWGRLSIATKLYVTMLVVGCSLLIITLNYTYQHEKSLVEAMARQQIKAMSESYFEGLNTLMLSGAMANKNLLHKKMSSQENILDIKLIRSESIQAMFHPSEASVSLTDNQRQAFTGQTVVKQSMIEQQSALTVLTPIIMSRDHGGVDCLSCHVTSKEGETAAVIEVAFSLASAQKIIYSALLKQASLLTVVFFIGMLMLALIFRSAVAKRLKLLRNRLLKAADNSDLAVDFSDQYHDEISGVYASLQSLVNSFKQSLTQLTSSSDELHDTAEQVSHVAGSTEQSVTRLKAGTDSVATTLVQIEASSNDVKQNAQFTTDRTQHASLHVESGAKKAQQILAYMQALVAIVKDANESLLELGERSERVNSMVEAISAIAEQTNLLALNAAIEAARAGEQGRGFAVVADEVRSLASRTHQSTGEIKQINEQLTQQKDRVISVMNEANTAVSNSETSIEELCAILEDIAIQSREIAQLNSQVAQAADQQNQAVSEVNQHVTSIQDIADVTAHDASQQHIISERVVALATELKRLVNSYKL